MKHYLQTLGLAILGFSAILGAAAYLISLESSYDAYILKEIGYESKTIGLECYAKYQNVWLPCKSVYILHPTKGLK